MGWKKEDVGWLSGKAIAMTVVGRGKGICEISRNDVPSVCLYFRVFYFFYFVYFSGVEVSSPFKLQSLF